MKKLWAVLLVLALAIGVFYISQLYVSNMDKAPTVDTTPAQETEKTTPAPSATPKPEEKSGLRFEPGVSANEILSALGEPKEKGEFEGSYYLSYGDIIYYVDSMDVQSSRVTAIDLLPGQGLFGVKVGMTPSEIKAVLGAPAEESASSEDESWTLMYHFKDTTVYFTSVDSKSPTDSARVKKED